MSVIFIVLQCIVLATNCCTVPNRVKVLFEFSKCRKFIYVQLTKVKSGKKRVSPSDNGHSFFPAKTQLRLDHANVFRKLTCRMKGGIMSIKNTALIF